MSRAHRPESFESPVAVCPNGHGPLNGQTKCRFCDFTIFMPEAVSSSSRNGLGTSAPTAPNGGAAPIFSSQYDELDDWPCVPELR